MAWRWLYGRRHSRPRARARANPELTLVCVLTAAGSQSTPPRNVPIDAEAAAEGVLQAAGVWELERVEKEKGNRNSSHASNTCGEGVTLLNQGRRQRCHPTGGRVRWHGEVHDGSLRRDRAPVA